jgi:hypothetical protein
MASYSVVLCSKAEDQNSALQAAADHAMQLIVFISEENKRMVEPKQAWPAGGSPASTVTGQAEATQDFS